MICGCGGPGDPEPVQPDTLSPGSPLAYGGMSENPVPNRGGEPLFDGTSSSDNSFEEDVTSSEAEPSLPDAQGPVQESNDTLEPGEPEGCYPECFAKQCGDDGCGGSCGQCPTGTLCDGQLCQPDSSCTSNCTGKDCGDDGCGGLCGVCPEEHICEEGLCQDTASPCLPDCNTKECGNDGCGGSCGACEGGLFCDSGQCACQPNCDGKTCGDDGCGGSCGLCGCDDQKVFVRAATLGEASEMQVFFINSEASTWDEFKSKTVNFDTDGEYQTLEFFVGEHPEWTGTITGLRVDPVKTSEPFGIDEVCVGVTADQCLLQWDFNGASEVTSPFFDWDLIGIENMWTDGEHWGGQGKQNDPRFRINLNFECDP